MAMVFTNDVKEDRRNRINSEVYRAGVGKLFDSTAHHVFLI